MSATFFLLQDDIGTYRRPVPIHVSRAIKHGEFKSRFHAKMFALSEFGIPEKAWSKHETEDGVRLDDYAFDTQGIRFQIARGRKAKSIRISINTL